MTEIINPGSLTNFALERGTTIDDDNTRQQYCQLLDGYRRDLAKFYGISPEDLHDMKIPGRSQAEDANIGALALVGSQPTGEGR